MSEKYRVRRDGFGRWIVEPFEDGDVGGIILVIAIVLIFGVFWLLYEILKTRIGRIIVISLVLMALIIAVVITLQNDEFHEVSSFTLLEDGTYELSAAGAFEDVVVPSEYNGAPVTRIGDNAFKDCETLKSVTIPDSITSIGENAFYNCNKLTSITIPSSVKCIGNSAFESCDILISIVIPNSVTEIGESVFAWCSSLTSVTLPNNLTNIPSRMFWNCNSLENITIPNGVTSIEESAFAFCDSLTSITIPKSVEHIAELAFGYDSSLTTINYLGTKSQWNDIEKVDKFTFIDGVINWDYYADNYTVYCLDGNFEK